MKSSTIHQYRLIKQDAKEGIFTMKGLSLTRLLHSLIREYGHYCDGTYAIDPNTFSISDKKLVLSHILDSEEYEWALQNTIRIEVVFNEHAKHVQHLLDNKCDEVYRDDMEDSGLTMRTHHDNNESYWIRK